MTGLKSGSGDDLWGDDGDDGEDETSDTSTDADGAPDAAGASGDAESGDDRTPGSTPESDERDGVDAAAASSDDDSASADEPSTEPATDPSTAASTGSSAAASGTSTDESGPTLDASAIPSEPPSDSQSYIVRRAVQDKSVQFERDERLTFFVHDDVAEGERDLITELQSTLGRDVPKFDVREAVYRAALQNPEDVLAELLKMGYSVDEE